MACFSGHLVGFRTVSNHPPLREIVGLSSLSLPAQSNCKRLLDVIRCKRYRFSDLQSPPPCRLLVFASTSQETATSTLVLQEVDFVWKGEGSQVLLTGDFLGWETKVPLVKDSDGIFHAKQKLPPGSYKYKFIVDGVWVHSPDSPAASDGQGGFNNEITVTDGQTEKTPTKTDVTPAKSSPKEVGGAAKAPAAKAAKKVPVDKPLPEMMAEDVIPKLKSNLDKEEDISNVEIVFQNNQLEGSLIKKGIIYTFWAFFPEGNLEGSRGFSLSSHGAPPSTVEPFLIDEKKITAELLIFWVTKRLFAQKILSMN